METDGLSPNWEFYNEAPKRSLFNIMLDNLDKMEVGNWYRIKSSEQKDMFIVLIDSGFAPDVVFNSDYSKVKRDDYQLIMLDSKVVKKILL